jgi:hypothetical protein
MRAGTKIAVKFIRPEGDVKESATIARVTKAMLPMPAGYVAVRFADGGVLLVHAQYISATA